MSLTNKTILVEDILKYLNEKIDHLENECDYTYIVMTKVGAYKDIKKEVNRLANTRRNHKRNNSTGNTGNT